MTITPNTHKVVAAKFCEIIKEWIGTLGVAKVVELNAEDPDKSVCHSHDFCDANQAMIDACEAYGIKFSTEDGSDFDKVCDKAWAVAKKAGFDARRVTV
jgi:hypothetical protein